MTINITLAQIEDEPTMPYYSIELCCYVWKIVFEYASTKKFNNLNIKVGDTEAKAIANRHQVRLNFAEANIYWGDKVAIIFDEEGNILALGKMKEDVWLDVTDNFKKKSFAELNIDITSLKVY